MSVLGIDHIFLSHKHHFTFNLKLSLAYVKLIFPLRECFFYLTYQEFEHFKVWNILTPLERSVDEIDIFIHDDRSFSSKISFSFPFAKYRSKHPMLYFLIFNAEIISVRPGHM